MPVRSARLDCLSLWRARKRCQISAGGTADGRNHRRASHELSRREVSEEYFGKIVGLPGCRVRAALLRVPGSAHHLELFEYTSPRGQAVSTRPCDPGSSHLALLVDDLQAIYTRLRAEGVAFVAAPVCIDAGPNAGGEGAYLRDPNGVLIELFQPPGRKPS
jgi:catechol 2,3-dioxygenase-like lactoylglutathione lyase family enzyme